MIVMKFGGTSVADAEAIRRVMSIVGGRLDKAPVIVVSALSKVTDTLYKICDFAENGDIIEAGMLVENIRDRHLKLIDELIDDEKYAAEAKVHTDSLCDNLKKLVDVICDLGELSERSRARIISTGEYLSSGIICCALNASGIPTGFIDARKLIITDENYLKGEPDLHRISVKVPEIINKAYKALDGASVSAVITQGFVSATEKGVPTVLGRGGSDYSASLIGMAMDADEIEIWTDVDGVHTADPRRVEGTRSLEAISFREAADMAHSGAKVLHPSTMEPAVGKNIPIKVLSSMNPSAKGTVILREGDIPFGVKSVSCKENVRMLNIFSSRVYNSAGFSSRVFSIFGAHHFSFDLIAVTEGSISVTIGEDDDIQEMTDELSAFATVFIETGKSQIAIVGKGLAAEKGVFGKIFEVLEGRRIYLMSMGAAGGSLSLVVDKNELNGIIQGLHKALFTDESGN